MIKLYILKFNMLRIFPWIAEKFKKTICFFRGHKTVVGTRFDAAFNVVKPDADGFTSSSYMWCDRCLDFIRDK